jgi:hypothetical protein
VAVQELSDDQPSIRLEHTPDLTDGCPRIRNLAEYRDQVGGVEAFVVKRQVPGVRPGRHDRADVFGRGPAHDVIQHLLLDVDDVESPARAKLSGHVQGLQAGTRPDLQDTLSWPGAQQGVEPAVGQKWQRQVEQPPLSVRVGGCVGPPPGCGGGHG